MSFGLVLTRTFSVIFFTRAYAVWGQKKSILAFLAVVYLVRIILSLDVIILTEIMGGKAALACSAYAIHLYESQVLCACKAVHFPCYFVIAPKSDYSA